MAYGVIPDACGVLGHAVKRPRSDFSHLRHYMDCRSIFKFVVLLLQPNYKAQAEACNVARNFDDIDDSWGSIRSIIEFYGKNEGDFASAAGPGFFNDPDEVTMFIAHCYLVISD